jgi:spermidine synthase
MTAPDAGLLSQLLALSTPDNALPLVLSPYLLFQSGDYRWLCHPRDAVQSVMRIEAPAELVLPHQHAMLLAAALPDKVESLLELGTGGGAFLRYVAAHWPTARLTSVDNDAQVQQIARQHFGLPPDANLVCDDALDFVQREHGTYDLVLVDLFRGREAPSRLAKVQTMVALSNRLTVGGAIAINTLPDSQAAVVQLLEAAREVFGGIALINFADQGNVVMVLRQQVLPDEHGWLQRLSAAGLESGIKVASISSRASGAVQILSLGVHP